MDQVELRERPSLLEEVEEFLQKAEPPVAASRLGRDVMRDPNFVRALRSGRVVRPTTVQKVRSYIRQKSVD